MRGLEIIIFMFCIVLAIPVAAVIFPIYGLDTGTADLSATNAFNWSNVQKYKPVENSGLLDQANYFLQLGIAAVTGIATLLFSSITLAPALLEIFAVNPVLSSALLSLLAITLILSWWQISRGDDWSGRR